MIVFVQDSKNRFRLFVNGLKIWNDQSLTLGKILQMVKTQKVSEDLIIELEDEYKEEN